MSPRLPLVLPERFGARADVQFLVNAVNVFADGVEADAHFLSNLFVTKALSQERQGLLLPFGQNSCLRRSGVVLMKVLHQLARNLPCHWRAAEPRLGNGFQQ